MDREAFRTEDRNKIVSILNRLKAGRNALTLTLADEEEEWSTTILKVCPDAESLFLSLPGDYALVQRLRDGASFDLTGLVQGVPVAMEALKLHVDAQAARDLLQIPVPACIYYEQKRDSVRLPLGELAFAVRLLGEQVALPGMLLDISYEGCRVGLAADAAPLLTSGAALEALAGVFPETDHEEIFAIALCHWQEVEGQVEAGLKFQRLPMRQQTVVDHLVMALQRRVCQAHQRVG